MPSVTIASRIVIPVGRIRPGGPVATAYDPGGGRGADRGWGGGGGGGGAGRGGGDGGGLGGGCCGWSDGVLRSSGMVCAPHPVGGPAVRRRSPRSPGSSPASGPVTPFRPDGARALPSPLGRALASGR